jgi:predicted CXXCH cytochrome family protein
MKAHLATLLLCTLLGAADQPGKIVRPPDQTAFKTETIEVIATAPEGKLELDGAPVPTLQPFPNVLRAMVKVAPGVHKLVLSWSGGRETVQFYSGPEPPAGFQVFQPHPPLAEVPCTQCHSVTRRGRFVFKGGCFDCHDNAGFTKVHTHNAEVLAQCGLCHNAHGSVTKNHLIHTREVACKQCHD